MNPEQRDRWTNAPVMMRLFSDAHRILRDAGYPATAGCVVAAYALAVARQRNS